MPVIAVLLQRSAARAAGLHKRSSSVRSRGDLEQTCDEATLSPDVVSTNISDLPLSDHRHRLKTRQCSSGRPDLQRVWRRRAPYPQRRPSRVFGKVGVAARQPSLETPTMTDPSMERDSMANPPPRCGALSYNPVRLHSALGYRSPMAYEAAAEVAIAEPT